MGKISSFFTMTRHERVGAAVVLVLLIVVLCVSAAISGKGADCATIDSAQVEEFERRCDSLEQELKQPSKPDSTQSKRHGGKSSRHGKRPVKERNMDPVPFLMFNV